MKIRLNPLLLTLAVVLAACGNQDVTTTLPPADGGTPSPVPSGTRPSVVNFSASPARQTAPGPVTLTWKVTGASTVQIAGVGDVSPAGAGSTTVNVTKNTTFLITATNAAGKSTARATVTLNAAPFSSRIDPAVRPFENTVGGYGGARPVAAVRDQAGLTSAFVADELIVLPGSQAELDALLSRTAGSVLDSYTDGGERGVLVRVDPSRASLSDFAADAESLGIPGENTFSSDQGARLLALVSHERRGGLRVGANFLDQPQAWLRQTTEGGKVTGETDAFKQPEFNNLSSKPGMVQAWQFVAAHGLASPSRRVRLAVIDGGFWLNPDGTSMKDAGGQGDFAPLPIQANFVGEGNASGANPANCGNGNACSWHGNGSASVAGGFLNNSAFAAGTGGQVSDLMLLRSDLGVYSVKHAIDWANGQNADVINMSFGGSCNWWCSLGKDSAGYYDAFDRAHDRGIFMVASAGNGGDDQVGDDVDDEDYEPCIISGVFCVGALGGDSMVYTNGAKAYSNHGGPVNLWAPTDIVAMPDGGSGGQFVVHNGTSAAAPYVAGVAAMMKAMNPALNYEQMRDMLQNTAWTDSPNPRVTRYLNAFAAVKAAAGNQLLPDRFEPNDTATRAATLIPGQYDDLNLGSAQDIWDYFRVESNGPSLATLTQSAPGNFAKIALGGLSKDSGCGDATLMSSGTDRTRSVYRLPSGSFHFLTVGAGPVPYDLNYRLETAPILPDTYEGAAGNDTFARRKDLGSGGSIKATLHTASDVDYYRFYSPGQSSTASLDISTRVKVLGADMPVTLRAYDDKGTLIGSSTTSADCSKPAEFSLPQGYFTVQVSGAASGAYSLSMGPTIKVVLRYQNVELINVTPGQPIEIDLRDQSQAVVLNNLGQFAVSGLTLHGADLHMTLLSLEGRTLGTGQAQDFQDGPGEVINLPSTLQAGQALVQIDRVQGALPTPQGIPAVVPATLEVLSAAR